MPENNSGTGEFEVDTGKLTIPFLSYADFAETVRFFKKIDAAAEIRAKSELITAVDTMASGIRGEWDDAVDVETNKGDDETTNQ